MGPRLLSLINEIEIALVRQGAPAVNQPPQRLVSFHKGLARMSFYDGSGAITLQNYVLADAQICIRATLAWAGTTVVGTHAIYPGEGFDWVGAADTIAAIWLRGVENLGQAPSPAENAGNTVESIAATG